MEPDFSGWATKAGLECSDGVTISSGAFKGQDKVKVPLVWQHGHNDPFNILGHAILEVCENGNESGVKAHAFFNNTDRAKHAREMVQHGDITMLSIWANELVKKSKRVIHGAIREVSLVMSGANPGAMIDPVTIRHSGVDEELDDEVIIYTGIPLVHSSFQDTKSDDDVTHEDKTDDDADVDETLRDIYETMSVKQKDVLHFLLASASSGDLEHTMDMNPLIKEIYEGMNDAQKAVVHSSMVAAGAEADEEEDDDKGDDADAGTGEDADADKDEDTKSDTDTDTDTDKGDDTDTKGSDEVKHTNIFEDKEDGQTEKHVLSHSDMETLIADATRMGSLKRAVETYAKEHLEHGIQDIDLLFPEARTLTDSPELFARRTEWVNHLLTKVSKVPFARIKTMNADITVPEARAKGYITGDLKKEEFFRVAKRVTTPTTIYKKQKLDRDDMIDITDFDVVTWLKAEMRVMLDEELARAILLGDGREANDEDKIDEERIRPIANDHELYTSVVWINLGDSNSSIVEFTDAIVKNRSKLRGSGMPTLYTTETYIAQLMLLRDTLGRNIYRNLDEVAQVLRVESVVPVEPMEEYEDLVGILVNPTDYKVGTDKGGQVSMFDDFDIDYNQFKYLIETRASGALQKLKSALVIKRTGNSSQLVVPNEPTFDGSAVTIVNTANVVYRNAVTDAVMTNAGSPYAVPEGETIHIVAEPANGYHVSDSDADDWVFTNLG